MSADAPPPPQPPPPLSSDAITAPLAVVDALFASAGRPAVDGDWGVAAYFGALAADPALASQVPDVTACNLDAVPTHGLVKFRGMVQHQGNPEFFFGAFPGADGVRRTVKFADTAADADDAAAMGAAIAAHGPHPTAHPDPASGAAPIWARQALYCTAVPGEPVVDVSPAAAAPLPAAGGSGSGAAKRGREGGDEAMAEAGAEAGAGAKPAKAAARPPAPTPTATPTTPPFPAPAPGDCVVFVYPAGEGGAPPTAAHHHPRLNEVVEVWGVLSRAPDLACAGGAGCDEHGERDAAALAAAAAWGGLPPTSLVPRVHALFVRPAPTLPPHHLAAAAAVGGPVEALAIVPRSLAPPAAPVIAAARAAAAAALAGALGGDALAAEYLLLQLVSKARAVGGGGGGGGGGALAGLASLAPGVLSLNVCGCPAPAAATPAAAVGGVTPFASRLATVLAALAPRCVALPVTVPSLNGAAGGPRRFRPSACPATDRLRPRAALQLAHGTQVLLDETAMAPGRLTPDGLDNARALQELLADKAVGYEFGAGARVPIPADAAVTVLSAGASSVLRQAVDIVLPLDAAAAAAAVVAADAPVPPPAADPAALAAARALFAGARACDAFDLAANGQDEGGEREPSSGEPPSPPVVDWIVEWMAATRAEQGGGAGSSPAAATTASAAVDLQGALHRTVELARLLALSHGEGGLSRARWEGAVAMEAARVGRVRDRVRVVRASASA